ncbi:MAG: hypothetical protein ABIE75_02975 [Candidatus Omnitrophota bacterium]
MMKKMELTPFYLIFRGFNQTKWMDAYALFSFALEALFSRDDKCEPTKTIINRVSRILNCSKTKINNLYEIRSDIVHGRIELAEKEDEVKKKENLNYLQDVENVVIGCLRKVLDEKVYLKYKNPQEREKYFDDLVENVTI